jgi:hypothetical protein
MKVERIPITTERMIYIKAVIWLPFRIISRFSEANAENVVKPPQNPVAKSNFSSFVSFVVLIVAPKTIPIKRHPSILTKKVPSGKIDGKNCLTSKDVA